MAKQHYVGLSAAEVAESRAHFGSNVLTPPEKESVWKKLGEKFAEPLIVVLLVAGFFSIGIACYNYYGATDHHGQFSVFLEPVGIFVAILLATVISFYFELKAEKEFSVLNQVNDEELVMVIRDGNSCEIPKRDVVVGDILLLSTGQEIPADAELLESTSLHIDESTLTGEPVCVKSVRPEDKDPEATFPTNHVMRGTTVMEGHGVAKVFAVGDATENGKVYEAAQIDNSVKTPLDEQLERLAKYITQFSYVIAVVLIAGRLAIYFVGNYGHYDWLTVFELLLNSFMVAVALIVCAVPEGLPMAVSLCLALSMRRMLKTNNLVRKMHACETMGATTVICTDKTGTLTQNRMQVCDADFEVSRTDDLINEGIAVNSTAQLDFSGAAPRPLGNPTEGALLLWLHQRGVDYRTIRENVEVLEEVPFSTERKYMAVTVRSEAFHGKVIRYVKGAPEIVFGLCNDTYIPHEELEWKLRGYQQQGRRTLGFAYEVDGQGLTFMGVVAIADPVREDVPPAVGECLKAGIKVTIVTGDTMGTAREIGRQIGIFEAVNDDLDHHCITGPEFAALTDEELAERVLDLRIIARARPMDKRRLVEALQQKGQVVAVTGDGTNDAPALNAAHVGLSMGDGTSVAKEASDITIIDNSFSSIARAVMWGRSLYRNIQRFVLFQMTVCVIAVVVVLIGAFTGKESPLTVTQMLWVNLIMDTFAAMALASLPPTPKVMKEKPRRRTSFIISTPMWWNIIGVGALLATLLVGLLVAMENGYLNGLLGYDYGMAGDMNRHGQSFFFTVFVMIQFWNLFNAAAFMTGRTAGSLFRAKGFVGIASAIIIGQLIIVLFGGEMFSVEPLSIVEWLVIIGLTSCVLWVGEIIRKCF